VSTYGAIAHLAGVPRQARLVGYALHTLRADSTVPWHRVINAAGRIALGDASGSATTQRLRLVAEGVDVAAGGRVSLKRFGWPAQRKHATFGTRLTSPTHDTMATTHRSRPSRRPKRAPSISAPTIGPVNEWFELRRSRIQGVGAFALQDIVKGTRLIEYTGEKISNAEADRRYDDESMGRHHTFLFILNQRTVIDAAYGGNESMYINHSCNPNCEAEIIRGRIWIEAIRDIPEGAELTYDYQYENDSDYTEDDLRFYACRCGSDNCRGTIVKTRKRIRP